MSTFTWSFSSLKDFINCPKQYHEVKVLKRFEKRPTQQMLYGTAVHGAMEDYVKEGKPLAKNYERFKPMLDSLVEIEGDKYPEHRMALDYNKQPCRFGTGYWVRGIADLLIKAGDTAFIVDYKTGSDKYPDLNQLKLMALMTFAHFEEVERVKAGLLFVMHNNFIPEEYTRDQIPDLWDVFEPHLSRLQLSYENGMWNANPTPLCGWCPVTTCEHHKGR